MDRATRLELRQLRRARGFTQEELAEAAGLSVRTVGHLERGGMGQPHPQTVRRLAGVLQVDVELVRRLIDGGSDQTPAAPPLGVRFLVGREPDLQRLTEAAARSTAVVVIGPGGVGKTALCLDWAHRGIRDFPDGIVFLDLHGFDQGGEPLASAEGLRSLLIGLGEPAAGLPEDPDELMGRYHTVTAERRCLVLLDNARSSNQVRPLLPAGRGCRTLVTSRRRLDGLVAGDGARLVGLQPLTPQDAIELLRERGSAAVDADRLGMLAEACGRLPLALVIMAAQLERNAERVLASSWEPPDPRSLDLLEVEDGDRSLRRVLAATMDSLPAPARAAADLFGVWPHADIDEYAAAALFATTPAGAVRLLNSLAELHLLDERTPTRYARHDLVGAYLAERAAGLPAGDRAAALRRVYRYHLALLSRYWKILVPRRTVLPIDADDEAVLPDLRTPDDVADHHAESWEALTAVIRLAQRLQAAPYSWQLAYAASPVFERRGPRSAWIETTQRALELVPDGDPVRHRMFNLLGIAHAMSGRLEVCRTHLHQALALVPRRSPIYAHYRTARSNGRSDVSVG